MKSSYRLRDLSYDIAEFLHRNKWKFIVFLAVFIVSCAFGVASGCAAESEAVLEGRLNFALLVGGEDRNVVVYACLSLIGQLVCAAVIILTSLNCYLCVFAVVILFYSCYIFGFTTAVFFSYFGLAAAPYMIICYIPHAIAVGFALCCLCALCFNCSLEFRKCGVCREIFFEYFKCYVLCLIFIVVSSLYCGLLGAIFTSGLAV